jgi:antiviral helicase SKI2
MSLNSHLKEFRDCEQYSQVRKVISRGIGYHHSGLIPKIREVIEFLIKNKLVKLVFATETFAVGLNFPVKTVVMTSLTKPTERGFRYLTPSEYKQMAGRAGRRFLDPFGNVILMLFL